MSQQNRDRGRAFGHSRRRAADIRADETRRHKADWPRDHCRHFRIGGITVQVQFDLPVTVGSFHPDLSEFQVAGPDDDMVLIHHHFSLPELDGRDLGKLIYRRPPWAIYRKDDVWFYLGISPSEGDSSPHKVAVFEAGYSRARVFNVNDEAFRRGGIHSLAMFPSDLVWLVPLLAEREGCVIHSAGAVMNGQGLLFVGPSEAGKSATVTMLKDASTILCDDRIIVRRRPEGFRIYGTWSHGTVPAVSAQSAPLRAIFFAEKAAENRLVPIESRGEVFRRLLPAAIRGLVTVDWWQTTMALAQQIGREVPAYRMLFDTSGRIGAEIRKAVD